MLDAFEAACESLGFANVHVERFRAVVNSEPSVPSGQCVVELAKSGRTMTVPKDKALLGCLLAADVEVQYSCEEGVCGTCETRIISGEADHRDSILTKSQKASNSVMMVCISRCKSDHMVLDL
jgi:vanillate O-demethylase ferredoxin subunit